MTEQRYRAVLEVLAGVPVTEVGGRYGVSRQNVPACLAGAASAPLERGSAGPGRWQA